MRIVVIGAGGHAHVVAEIALATGAEIVGFIDDNPLLAGSTVLGYPVFGAGDVLHTIAHDAVALGVGENSARARLHGLLASSGECLPALIHPAAIVSPTASVGEGAVVVAGAVINAQAHVGIGAVVNTGASVDHHSVVGDHAHIAPGARLAGGCSIGDRALLGIGAVVLPGRTIGADTVVGAGAVVVDDLPSGVVAFGVPARVVRHNTRSP